MQETAVSREFVERQVSELVAEVIARLQREEPEKLKQLAEELRRKRGSESVN